MAILRIFLMEEFCAPVYGEETSQDEGASANPFDPSGYMKKQTVEDTKVNEAPTGDQTVRQDVVRLNGRDYYKFQSGKSSILVPKLDRFTKQDLERSLCTQHIEDHCDPNKVGSKDDPLCKKDVSEKIIGVRARQALSKDTVIYSDLILANIQHACSEGQRPNAVALRNYLEIGVEVKNNDPRNPGSKKGFIRMKPNLTPEVGGGVSF
jgi:hypothetical protein